MIYANIFNSVASAGVFGFSGPPSITLSFLPPTSPLTSFSLPADTSVRDTIAASEDYSSPAAGKTLAPEWYRRISEVVTQDYERIRAQALRNAGGKPYTGGQDPMEAVRALCGGG